MGKQTSKSLCLLKRTWEVEFVSWKFYLNDLTIQYISRIMPLNIDPLDLYPVDHLQYKFKTNKKNEVGSKYTSLWPGTVWEEKLGRWD